MARGDSERIVVVQGGGAMSVFWGLVLFFIVMPIVVTVGCFACAGAALHEAGSALHRASQDSRPITPSANDSTANSATDTPINVATRKNTVDDARDSKSAEKPYEFVGQHGQMKYVWIHPDHAMNRATYDQAIAEIAGDRQFAFLYFWSDRRLIPSGDFTDRQAHAQVARYTRNEKTGHEEFVFLSEGEEGIKGQSHLLPPEVALEQSTSETEGRAPGQNAASATEPKALRRDHVLLDPSEMKPKAPESAHKMRTWTSRDGRTLQAQFAGRIGGMVQLKKPDGTVVKVPLERLSEADQRYATGERAKK
jgi:hypothetical protein